MVVGHKNCGGVNAAYNAAFPNSLEMEARPSDGIVLESVEGSQVCNSLHRNALNRWLAPLVDHLKSAPQLTREHAYEKNVCIQVQNLLTLKRDILEWSKGELVGVHGWLYDFTTGIVKHIVTEEIIPLVH